MLLNNDCDVYQIHPSSYLLQQNGLIQFATLVRVFSTMTFFSVHVSSASVPRKEKYVKCGYDTDKKVVDK